MDINSSTVPWSFSALPTATPRRLHKESVRTDWHCSLSSTQLTQHYVTARGLGEFLDALTALTHSSLLISASNYVTSRRRSEKTKTTLAVTACPLSNGIFTQGYDGRSVKLTTHQYQILHYDRRYTSKAPWRSRECILPRLKVFYLRGYSTTEFWCFVQLYFSIILVINQLNTRIIVL